MPMSPVPGVSLNGLAIGDPVEFDLSVWYKPENKGIENFRLTQIKKTMFEMETEYHAPQTSAQRQADLIRQLKELGNEYTTVNQKRKAILTGN